MTEQPHGDTLPDSICQQISNLVHDVPALPEDTQNTSPDQNSFRTNPTLSANSTDHHVARRLQHIPQSLQFVSRAPTPVKTEDIAIDHEVGGLPAPFCLSLLTSSLFKDSNFIHPCGIIIARCTILRMETNTNNVSDELPDLVSASDSEEEEEEQLAMQRPRQR
jgi:hypothetical protein